MNPEQSLTSPSHASMAVAASMVITDPIKITTKIIKHP
jgi:hypothetical protein